MNNKINNTFKNTIRTMITEDMVLDCEEILDLYKKIIVKKEKHFQESHNLIRTHNTLITNICDTAWNTVYAKHGLSHIYVPIDKIR